MTGPLAEIQPGQKFADRYTIRAEIARTNISVLYRAYDEVQQHEVCLKFPNQVIAARSSDVSRLRQEFATTTQLNHDNIVKSYKFELLDEQPCFILEFIEGRTLEEIIPQGEGMASYEEICRYLLQIKDALSYAHAAGVVHRDLKPANIMIEDSDHIKVLDFNIARVVKETFTRVTNKGDIGTLLYMAPEQLRGKDRKVGPASDWYALGCVTFEMITGYPPFYQGDITYQHLKETPPAVTEFRKDCPPPLTALVAALLEKDPEARTVRIPDFVKLIDRLGTSDEKSAEFLQEELTGPVKPRLHAWQRPWAIAALLFIALCLAVSSGLLGFYLFEERTRTEGLEVRVDRFKEIQSEEGERTKSLDADIEELGVQIADLRLEIENLNREKEKLEETLEERRGQIEKLKNEKSELKRQLSEAKTDLFKTGEALTNLESQHEILDQRYGQLQNQVDDMNTNNKNLAMLHQECSSRATVAEVNIKNLSRELTSCGNYNRELAERLASSYENLQEEHRGLQARYHRKNEEIKALDRKYDNLSGRYDDLNRKYRKLKESTS